MISNYLSRVIEKEIAETMRAVGCVVIEGPKACGKSTTAQLFSRTNIELQEPNEFRKMQLLILNGVSVFNRAKPILFDEWQKIPELWDMIRSEVDRSNAKGDYILTGSAKPIEDFNRHSGVGRFGVVTMRPMSLYESLDSVGSVSLGDLFEGKCNVQSQSVLTLERIAELICRGGWPGSYMLDKKSSQTYISSYYKLLTEIDLTEVDGVKRNPERAKRILKSLARNISSFATDRTIIEDVKSHDMSMDEKTLTAYLHSLRKLFVIEDQPAWSPKLRSKTIFRTTSKRQFVDPSIAAIALGVRPNDLLNDPETFGLMFESLCIRDLRVYANSLDGSVYQYHDRNGLEADAVVHLSNGNYGIIEIKLGQHRVEEAVKNLIKLQNKIDIEQMKKPKFLMIITGTGIAYRRKEDGIYVVPIGCLKP